MKSLREIIRGFFTNYTPFFWKYELFNDGKNYISQCFLCKKFGKESSSVRVWEKEVLYRKPEGEQDEKEGQFVMCKSCYSKLK